MSQLCSDPDLWPLSLTPVSTPAKNISEINGNTALRITCTGPFADLANINSTENVTVSLYADDPLLGATMVDDAVNYEVSRDHSVSESGYWIPQEKNFKVGQYV